MSGNLVFSHNLHRVSSLSTILRNSQRLSAAIPRPFSTACPRRRNADSQAKESDSKPSQDEEEQGALSRKLSAMTEDAMLEGGRSTRKNMEQAGFSEDLKNQLEERIAGSSFKDDYAAAHSIVDMPEGAGQGTRDNAAATPWTGEESLHDVTLRMLDSSAKKPMRTTYKPPQPGPVDFRFSRKPPKSPGLRIAGAKESTATYELSRSPGVSDFEREKMRQEMRERFSPGARPMPVSVDSLSSIANERIEDVMSRGQFNKIKRGKGVNVETDHNANSAYIDTTEYFMNKIIQSQEVVPPWIEKQQELKKEVDRFRQRLRADWRRHAARLVASQGGSLDAQIRRAKGYAAAEARLADRAKMEAAFRENGDIPSTDKETAGSSSETESQSGLEDDTEQIPYLPPLRDPHYLSIDRSYHELAVKNLNTLTRSYNLQAPQLALKPYLNLDRELSACFADVAPTLPEEIKRRATEKASSPASTVSAKASTVMESLGTTQTVRVYDEDKSKGYGLKEFFNDLFSRKRD